MKKHSVSLFALAMLVSIGLLRPRSAALAESPIWITVGLGSGGVAGGGSATEWFSGRIAMSWCQGPGHWTISYYSCGLPLPMSGFGSTVPREHVSDLGILYGKRWSQPGLGFVSVSGGIAFVHGMRRGEFIRKTGSWFSTTHYYEKEPFTTVGLPIDMQFCLAPFNSVGLALDLFGNLNPERSYRAATLSLIIGELW